MLPARPLPEFFVGKIKSNELISNFKKKKHAALKSTLPSEKDETESIWYSIEHIENLYKELIYLNADGMRIYFGAYGDGCIDKDTSLDYSNQLCLVMLPTYTNPENGKHKDLIQEHTGQFRSRNGSDIFVDADGKILPQPEGGIPRGFNQGKPCPPLCNGQEPAFPLVDEA